MSTEDGKVDGWFEAQDGAPLSSAAGSTPDLSCDWHKNEQPLAEDESPGCQGCGRMYSVTTCEKCGKDYLDWRAKGYDDIIAGPYVTTSGDLYCTACGPREDREMEEAESENDFGDHP